MKCKRCGNTEEIERHHILPVCFFGKKKNKDRVLLCHQCHREVEHILYIIEDFVGFRSKIKGFRYQLTDNEYKQIAKILHLK